MSKKLILKYQKPAGTLGKIKRGWNQFKDWSKTLMTSEGREQAVKEIATLEPIASTFMDFIPIAGTTYRLGKGDYAEATINGLTDLPVVGTAGKIFKTIKKVDRLLQNPIFKGQTKKLVKNSIKKREGISEPIDRMMKYKWGKNPPPSILHDSRLLHKADEALPLNNFWPDMITYKTFAPVFSIGKYQSEIYQ